MNMYTCQLANAANFNLKTNWTVTNEMANY